MRSGVVKDGSVWRFVGDVAQRLNAREFQIVDHWDGDLLAIGIADTADEDRLVYVSTFRQPPDRYWYECEEPQGEDEYAVPERMDAASLDQVVDAIRRHLRLGGLPGPG